MLLKIRNLASVQNFEFSGLLDLQEVKNGLKSVFHGPYVSHENQQVERGFPALTSGFGAHVSGKPVRANELVLFAVHNDQV